jgi:hypothetical protein
MTMSASSQQAQHVASTGCCLRFDREQTGAQELDWQDKPFVKEHVRTLFHVPLNMGRKIAHARVLIEAAGAQPEQPILLGDERSPWGADIYLETTKDVPGAEMVRLSGRFLVKTFEGPFRDAQEWMGEMRRLVSARGQHIERLFQGFTTCPVCPKGYGENCVVLYAKLA